MKTTAQRLSEVYCRPTAEEWDLFPYLSADLYFGVYHSDEYGSICFEEEEVGDRTEIPVSHFIDLLSDLIVSWRLEDDSPLTLQSNGDHLFRTLLGSFVVSWDYENKGVLYSEMNGDHMTSITTYTQLLTLIELIG